LKSRRFVSQLLLVCGSLLVSVLLAEGILRVQFAWQDQPPPHWDRSLVREWRWAQAHLRAGTALLPGEAIYDPELGWSEKPNVHADGVNTNSVGMRAQREFAEQRNNAPRLLLVGDSYTFAAFATDEVSYHHQLGRQYLPGWEILNMGVSGYGPDQTLLLYQKRGRRYRPDVVVFGFYDRGFFRMFNSFRSYAKPVLTLDEDGELRVTGVPVISPEALYASYASGERRMAVPFHSYALASLVGNVARATSRARIEREDERWQLMAAVLRRFHDDARAAGSLPFLLVFPNRPHECDGCVYEQLGQLAELEARELGMPSLSLAPAFRDHEGEPLFRPKGSGGHLSAAGHTLTARLLYEALEAAGYLRERGPGG
jgi:hypothetical protein